MDNSTRMAHLSASIAERVPAGTLVRATRALRPPPLLMPWTPWTPLCSQSVLTDQYEVLHWLLNTHISITGLSQHRMALWSHIHPQCHMTHEKQTNHQRHLFSLEIFMEMHGNHSSLQLKQAFDFKSAWNTWYYLNPYINIDIDINKWFILTVPGISYGLCSACLNCICFSY